DATSTLSLHDALPISLEHERMLSTLGSYVAVALENARLYEGALHNERRLRTDLDTAREIQRQYRDRCAGGVRYGELLRRDAHSRSEEHTSELQSLAYL